MKKHLLFLASIFFFTSTQARVQVDNFISIDLPGEVIKLDTVVKELPLLQYYSIIGLQSFIVQKLKMDSKEGYMNELPGDKKALEKTYDEIIKGLLKSLGQKGIELQTKTSIEIGKYKAYRLRYTSIETRKAYGEAVILVLEESLYQAMYFTQGAFNESAKERFLSSLTVNESMHPRQLAGKSKGEKIAYLIGNLIGLGLVVTGIVALIIFIQRRSKRSRNTR